MNIFTISSSPIECAEALDDKRLVKMSLETAQMLCSSLYAHGCRSVPYKPAHINHPCTKWAAETLTNWQWLFQYLGALNSEYRKRFQKEVDLQAYTVIVDNNLPSIAAEIMPAGELTEFFNCSAIPDLPLFEAYQACLNRKWSQAKSPPRWTNAQPPLWKL